MSLTRRSRAVCSFAVCAAALCLARPVCAQPSAAAACGTASRPWVAVHAPAELPGSVRGFVDLLRAELASRGIDLCAETSEGAAAAAPIATIDVASSPDEVTLSVEVHDAVTAKHVSRDVSLGGVPADSRPLTVALAADELLRASWAELALRRAPPTARPVPPEVTQTVRESVASSPTPPPAPPRVLLGVDAALERFASGTTFYGADASFAAWIVPRVAASLHAGLRSGAVIHASDGQVQPEGWLAGVGAQVGMTPPGMLRWGIDALARFDVEHVGFTPTAYGPAVGVQGSALAVLTELGAQAWLRILPTLRLGVRCVAMLPIRPVDATDAGREIAGVSGAGIGAQLGLWSTL